MKKIVISILLFITAFFCDSAARAADIDIVSKAEWTVMIYMNGDNDLDACVYNDMTEIEKIGSNSAVNIIVQADRAKKTARRYIVRKNDGTIKNDDWGLVSECLSDVGEVDMGDYKEFVNFFDWGIKNYPAEKYALIIWNHGTGWKRTHYDGKSISFDDTSKNAITTVQLGIALEKMKKISGKKLDLLIMDACLMQMIEVLAEIQNSVDFVCASEDIEPNGGMPYETPFKFLTETPNCNSREFAGAIVKCFHDKYYAPRGENSTFYTYSAVDCSKINDFMLSFKNLTTGIANSMNTNSSNAQAMAYIRKNVQRYSFRDYADIGDMLKFMKSGLKSDNSLAGLIDETLKRYNKLIVANVCGGVNVANSTGISIYIPNYAIKSHYKFLKFNQTGWTDFLTRIFGLNYIDSKPDSQMY